MANIKFSQIANGGNINLTNDQVLIVRGGNVDNLASIPGMINALYDGANSITSGTVQFSNSNGVSFGINGSMLTGSVAAQSVQSIGIYAISNTTGASSSSTIDARSLSFDALGAISVGISNGSIQLSVAAGAQSNQTVGGYALGNTTLSTSNTMDARSLSFVGDGIASVGMSNGSVQISVPSPPVQTNQSIGIYAVSNTTLSTSGTIDARTLSFEGAGAVSIGVSNGSVQISAPNTIAQTNQTVGLYGLGNTTQNSSTTLDARSLSLDGLGGITVGYSNGSIQISGAQTAAQTNQSLGLYAVSNTTLSTSGTIDARSLSFEGAGGVSVGVSNGSVIISGGAGGAGGVALYDGANSITSGTARFTNANGVSFTFNGQTISGSVAAQTNQSLGFYAVGNTTQSSSTTRDARTLSFNFLGAVTGGFSNGSIDISAPAQTNQSLGFYAVGNTTQNSSTTLDARTLSFDGLGAQTVGYSNGSIQLSVPATSSLVGVGGVSVSTNGSTISISYLGASQLNDYAPWPLANTTLTSFGQNSLNLGAFYPNQNLSMNNIALLVSLGYTTSIASQAVSETISCALYSKGTGASSTLISQMASSSIFLCASYSGVLSAGYTISAGTNSTTYSSAGTGSTSAWTGQKIFSIPFATSFSAPGEYWFGLANSTASVGDTLALALSYIAVSGMSNASFGNLAGNGINVSNKSIVPNTLGVQMSYTSASWPATIAYSDMSNQASNLVPYVFLAT